MHAFAIILGLLGARSDMYLQSKFDFVCALWHLKLKSETRAGEAGLRGRTWVVRAFAGELIFLQAISNFAT